MMSGLKSTTAETSALSTANQPTVGNKNIGANSVYVAGKNAGKKDDKDSLWCNHCQKPRHTRDNCWKIHGRPANLPQNFGKARGWNKGGEGRGRNPASRATDQMTGNSSLFCSYTPFNGTQMDLCTEKKIGSAREGSFRAFAINLSHVSIPRDIHEAMRVPKWQEVVNEEETFALVAKMNTVRVLLSITTKMDWALQQLYVKNAFLHGDLEEEVFMELPPGFEDQLGIEVARSRKGIVLSQRKYILDLLKETSMLGCKPIDTPIDVNIEMSTHIGDDRRSTSDYCTFLGGNLIMWKSKKQAIVARSSAETEFKALALRICELIWLKSLMCELRMPLMIPMKLYCDNKATISIAYNPVQHDRTKHAEIDQHFIKEKIEVRLINLSHVSLKIVTKRKPLLLVVLEGIKGNGWEDLWKAILSVQEYPDQVGGASKEKCGDIQMNKDMYKWGRSYAKVVAEDGFRTGGMLSAGKWARAVICECQEKVQDWTHEGKAIARMMAKIHFEEVGEGNEGGKGNFEAVELDEVAVSVTEEDDEDDAVTSETTRSRNEWVKAGGCVSQSTKIAEGL
ncbi:Retrovirus-related Pol polyprotein from transposon RE1 [Vitis vinifera]|uniref:Retrovirus-related Pol polyprotein from transposon RE1 n=1 Tax=Vitis vinifera TaxID=29760 RepID=A0A438IJI6_VITVI|nr:Retrovirus-related Pol polyprotein from transposon RE1 [Vitis vinifera]